MLQRVRKYIEQNELLNHNAKHLVALSGGADSVALLIVLKQLEYDVEAVHCNFKLRGEESNRDERFCIELCKQIDVPLHIVHFDTQEYAVMHKISIEMAARDLRYGYFRQLRTAIDATDICVAHHKDDQAETMLLNIIRGTGLRGLAGMKPRNEDIVRPFLCVSRTDIEDFLTLQKQDYVTDSTNLVNDVKRNKIRLDILPLLKEINPSIVDSLVSTADNVRCAVPVIESFVSEWKSENGFPHINLKALHSSPSPKCLLFEMLHPLGFNSAIIDEIATSKDIKTGCSWSNNDGTKVALADRGCLIIDEPHQQMPHQVMPIEGNYRLSNGSLLEVKTINNDADFTLSKDSDIAQLDAAKVKWPLTLRNAAEGDCFQPFGMKGTKLVSDFLTDRKVPLTQKRRTLCVTDATGTIIWLVGHRINERFRFTSDTIKVLKMRYIINE